MLLQRLREYAERQDDLGPPMYVNKLVRYEVALDDDGRPLSLIELTGEQRQGRNAGKLMMMPDRVRSGAAVRPILLTDTAEYALGWSDRPDKAASYNAAFIELVNDAADATGLPELRAVARYFERDASERLAMPEGFERGWNVTFSVAGQYPTDHPAVQRFWAEYVSDLTGDTDDPPECLVCGRRNPVVRILPQKIKGIPGGQSSGTALISTNENAFESYGLDDMSCAPVCIECAEATSKALNKLLATTTSHVRVNPLVYAYWSRDGGAGNVGMFLSDPDPQEVAVLLRAAETGQVGALGIPGEQFYCVGLGPSGGRAAVRDWLDTSVERVERNLARYFRLMTLVEPWGSDEARYFGVWRLARGTLRSNAKATDSPDPNVPRALLRCALQGGPLPDWLLAQVIKRLRAEQEIDHLRAALIKMVLASQHEEWTTTMAGLDEQNRHPAYLCGRLLAVLDQIQRAALGQRNATIIDRFFGTASSAPMTVFPRLVRGAQPHLSRLRRDRPTTGRALEIRMQEIIDLLDGFPRTLALREQGLFVLGYYHQRAADRRAMIERREQAGAESVTPTDENQEG